MSPATLDEIVVFDLETTGLDPWADRIIEFGAVRLRNGVEQETFQSLVDPERALPPEITALTGIGAADLAGAPRLADVLPRFLAFVGEAPLVAHNADGFDRQFLERALGRRLENPVLDTLPFAFLAHPQAPSHSLAALARDLAGGGGGRHRALDDARDLARVLAALLARLAQMPAELRAEAASLVRGTSWPWRGVVAGGAEAQGRFRWTRRSYTPAKKNAPPPDPEQWSLQPIDAEAAAAAFRAGGAVAREKTTFEERPQQAEMARAVASAVNDGVHLAVEAGTGVGKSYAYLIPALQWGKENGRPVVVSTYTKVLQAQLAADVPTLEKALGRPIRVAIVKGRSNYLCLHKWEEWHDEVRQGQRVVLGGPESLDEPVVAAMVASWEERTVSGDAREELPWWLVQRGPADLLSRVTIDAEHCPGQRCPIAQNCFVTIARRRAMDADLVIVNHRLLLESYLSGRDDLLPPNPVLVIDEAHHLEGVATDVLSRESSYPLAGRFLNEVDDAATGRGALRRVVRLLQRNEPREVYEAVERIAATVQDGIAPTKTALAEFFGDLDAFVRTNAEAGEEGDVVYARRLRVTTAIRAMAGWDLLRRRSTVVVAALRRLLAALRTLLQSIEPVAIEGPSRMELHRAALRTAADRLEGIAGLHEALFAEGELPGWVVWAESEPQNGDLAARWTSRLRAAPIDVGPALGEGLYARVRSIVFTSATLTTSSRSDEFRFMRMRLGWDALGERLRTLKLDSPYDYEKQVLALTLVDLPTYEGAREAREAFLAAVAASLPRVLAANHGGTLVLCTSHEQVDRLYPICRERLEPLGIACLRQRKGQSIRQQIERFREDVDSVLFGTASLWEGIDVPGEALDGLVVVKLPFDPPNDPVIEARREAVEAQGMSGSHYYYYPLAILRLRQGIGRLIRSTTDRGVCVVLDRRLAQTANRYSVQFRNSLPRGLRMRNVSTEEAVDLIRKFVGARALAPDPSALPGGAARESGDVK